MKFGSALLFVFFLLIVLGQSLIFQSMMQRAMAKNLLDSKQALEDSKQMEVDGTTHALVVKGTTAVIGAWGASVLLLCPHIV